MPCTIHFARTIDAPRHVTWDVVSDLARYAEWNPFVVQAHSSLRVGDPIAMRVRVFPFFAR